MSEKPQFLQCKFHNAVNNFFLRNYYFELNNYQLISLHFLETAESCKYL